MVTECYGVRELREPASSIPGDTTFSERWVMNKDQFTARWPEIRSRVRTVWNRLTDRELDQVQGSAEILVGIIQEKYEEPRKVIEMRLAHLIEEPRQQAPETQR